ncbi:MAG: hypothetical protein ACERKD_10235 [Prolixibacteraceae bacterium]
MKITGNKMAPNIFLAIATVIVVFAFSSCATRAMFLQSAVVPAAKGKVIIKEDGNNNFAIKVNINNLAQSKNLQPAKNAYVVWMVTNDTINTNIGQIVSSTGAFSSKLKASFETVSAFRPSKVFITAENEADVLIPYSAIVISTDFIGSK